MSKSSEQLSSFLSFCRDVQSQYSNCTTELDKCEQATQDLLHQLEIGLSRDRGKFATKLSHVRKQRRNYKNFVDINKVLVEYMQSDEFVRVYRRLEQMLGEVRKKEKYINNTRQYKSKRIKVPIDKGEEHAE